VASIADRVVVLYAGRVCEQGPAAAVFAPPHHPYTELLLSSVPTLRPGWLEEVLASRGAAGGQSGMVARNRGCPFQLRCSLAIEQVCDREPPPPRRTPAGQTVHCHRELAELEAAQALSAAAR
jgi:peptide/nickel transport system ATP-binding protein